MNYERFLNNPEYADKKIAQLTQKLKKKESMTRLIQKTLKRQESKKKQES